jgi:hypothetical protein
MAVLQALCKSSTPMGRPSSDFRSQLEVEQWVWSHSKKAKSETEIPISSVTLDKSSWIFDSVPSSLRSLLVLKFDEANNVRSFLYLAKWYWWYATGQVLGWGLGLGLSGKPKTVYVESHILQLFHIPAIPQNINIDQRLLLLLTSSLILPSKEAATIWLSWDNTWKGLNR